MATAICMAKATESNMASRIIPGISLRAFWDLGESGWKAGMDENIWRLSFLVQSRVLGVVETLPPGPAEGDRYILNNDASPYDQHIMVYDQALWVPIVPEDRFVVFNTENDSLMYFNLAGITWVSLISPEAIKEAYESNPNTNEFTDDEKAKLSDIEDNATADMTAEEIKAAYESNPNSNAFTDAEKAKLSGLSSSRFLGIYPTLGSLQSSHPAPAEGSFGYVDSGPLLDIVCYIWDANSVKYVLQASAGGMETPETIKTKYESNEDTNAFTDAEKVKLALIDPDEPGPEGPQGLSAYQVALANGFVGTEVEWLASLVGADGDDGLLPNIGPDYLTKTATTLTLTSASSEYQIFTGDTAGQVVQIPDASSCDEGKRFYIWNREGASIVYGVNLSSYDLLAYQAVKVVRGFDTDGTTPYWIAEPVVSEFFTFLEVDRLFTGSSNDDDPPFYINPMSTPNESEFNNGSVWMTDTTFKIKIADTIYDLLQAPPLDDTSHGTRSGGTLHAEATDSVAGFMSSADKTKLDSLSSVVTESLTIALSDLASDLEAGTVKETIRMPYAFTLTGVRAYLATAQASGSILTVDINKGGVSILSTKLTIDNGEKTSTTATTPTVISDTALADDAEITFDIDQVGSGGAGLKIILIGHRT